MKGKKGIKRHNPNKKSERLGYRKCQLVFGREVHKVAADLAGEKVASSVPAEGDTMGHKKGPCPF
jgi:hypothetical protein